MNVLLHKSIIKNNTILAITGSKSETNRLLILKALYGNVLLKNVSDSQDTKLLQQALQNTNSIIDVHHAGTAMRFLTAYYAIQQNNNITLLGSERMHERPIAILVDALRELGADISYVANEGFPPLSIKGRAIEGGELTISAEVSSQYISALLLVAPLFKKGLTLKLTGQITSLPYIEMTLELLSKIGVKSSFEGRVITVNTLQPSLLSSKQTISISSDWSSASYWYSCIALSPIGTSMQLGTFLENSLQGDARLAEIYTRFGVATEYSNDTIIITKKAVHVKKMRLSLQNTPDIAQTIAVTCLGLGVCCELNGLHTLKIKETDRLVALKNELEKFGTKIAITQDALKIQSVLQINSQVEVNTYQDHRMAMAFMPLALITSLTIKNAEVVEKSYPSFWKDVQLAGIKSS